MLYEFITPSDPITFHAADDGVAFCVATLLGNGKAGCKNCDTEKSLASMTAFMTEEGRKEIYSSYCGGNLEQYVEEHLPDIAAALQSFAYGSPQDRKVYDAALAAITEPEKLDEFKKIHEDSMRTSMSRWVAYAWEQGQRLASYIQENNKKEGL